jgi:hypothetical protein
MYGKVYRITSGYDLQIENKYFEIEEEYNNKSKELCEKFHFTTMYKVMSYHEVTNVPELNNVVVSEE